jgi:hypothetical protein
VTAAELGTFEGKDVIQVGVKFVGAATGLNAALKAKPELHGQSEEVYLVVRGHVKVGFEDIPGTDCLKRVESVVLADAAYVAPELASETLEQQTRMVEEALGVSRLPNMAAVEAHERGEHEAEPLFGCPICDEAQAKADEERDLAQREAEGKTGPTPKPSRRGRGAAKS